VTTRSRIVAVLAVAMGCSAPPPNLSTCVSLPSGGSQAWPEADHLFRHDPAWLGGDGAYSVGLTDGRVLWFFDDTYVWTGGARDRRHATFVHNSVGVQSGPDPSQATIQFAWRTLANGGPGSFFPDPTGSFYWMGAPALVEGKLLVFLMQAELTNSGLGFQYTGWNAALIDNPGDDPQAWNIQMLDPAPVHPSWYVGQAGVLVDGSYLYVHVIEDGTLDAYLERYALDSVAGGDLSSPEWWSGDALGWVAATAGPQPGRVLVRAGTEFSVQRDPDGSYSMVSVTAPVLLNGVLTIRTAPAIQGPWSATTTVYQPPEGSEPNVIVYAGKAHPELQGAPMVLTYASNNLSLAGTIDDQCLYYPRFVRTSFP
jgi:hypothetical protein